MVIVGADANAHSPVWFSPEEDSRGEELSDFIDRNRLQIANREGQPATHRSGTNIDITLITNDVFDCLREWTVHEDASTSDHRLITFKLDLTLSSRTIELNKHNMKRADYTAINRILSIELREINEIEAKDEQQLENKVERITNEIGKAMDTSIPKIKFGRKAVPWWNSRLTELKRQAARARRAYQQCCVCRIKLVKLASYRRLTRQYKNQIKIAKEESWQQFVAMASNNDPYSLVYKLGASKVKNKEILTTVEVGNDFTRSNLDTLQSFIDKLVPLSEGNIGDVIPIELPNLNEEPPFRMEELNKVLKKAKDKRAVGPDNIPVEIYKTLNEENKSELLQILNECWSMGKFPKMWKKAKLKIIKKAGDRDWSQIGSYRPISLLPTGGKILERLIATRLTEYLEMNNLMSNSQYGFRQGRSTLDTLVKIREKVQHTNCKYVIILMIDIKGAFDNVKWRSIQNSLVRSNVPKQIYSIIMDYLSNRTVSLSNDCETVERVTNQGCPQGSVLGPLLWNMSFDRLLERDYPEECEVLAFADDVAYLIEANSRRGIEEIGNQVCNIISDWANEDHMTIATDKTKGMVIKGKMPGRPPHIKYRDKAIGFVTEAKHLGLVLDSKMTFLPNTKQASAKAKVLFGKITRLVQLRYGVRYSQLDILYKTVYLPIISYGLRVWHYKLSNGIIVKSLRSSQHSVLKNITGAYRTTSLLALCIVTCNPPIDLKLKEMHEIWKIKKGLTENSIQDAKEVTRTLWNEEWSSSTKGRYTYRILQDVEDREKIQHLSLIDHRSIQLLTGHGANKVYLLKYNKTADDKCNFCGEKDGPLHAILECPRFQESRDKISDAAVRANLQLPWNFDTIIRNELTFKELAIQWKNAMLERNI